jgi:hypothetical protein
VSEAAVWTVGTEQVLASSADPRRGIERDLLLARIEAASSSYYVLSQIKVEVVSAAIAGEPILAELAEQSSVETADIAQWRNQPLA